LKPLFYGRQSKTVRSIDEEQMQKYIYNSPQLKKYGTMKVITQNGAFSGSLGGIGGGGDGGADPSVNPNSILGDDSNDAVV
jgi:hypothetical protein